MLAHAAVASGQRGAAGTPEGRLIGLPPEGMRQRPVHRGNRHQRRYSSACQVPRLKTGPWYRSHDAAEIHHRHPLAEMFHCVRS